MNMKQLLITKLAVWLGWFSYIALAQLELANAVTGSVSFPAVGLTCIGNLAVFLTSLLRRRLDLEMGVRDLLATITGPELKKIQQDNHVKALTTISDKNYKYASVLMLSTDTSNSSIGQFMKYMKNAYEVESILQECRRYDLSKCATQPSHDCYCIKFMEVEGIKEYLDCFTHNIVTSLDDSPWLLLPCKQCLKNGCHRLNPRTDIPVVCNALEFESTKLSQEKSICICIPLNRASEDDWTKALIRSFKSKDQQDRGVTVLAADALQSYLDGRKIDRKREVSYGDAALIIVPRLAEILINIVLTLWFKIDGFSSSLSARRAIRNNVVESKGVGFPASAFLTAAEIQVRVLEDNCAEDKYSVCQVLSFRCKFLSIRSISMIVGGFNFICSAYWAVFVALDGGARTWYEIHSMLPSESRLVVIIVAICFGCVMDFWDFGKEIRSLRKKDENKSAPLVKIPFKEENRKSSYMRLTVIVIEILFVAVVVVLLCLNEGIGRWVYSALQLLVWVKWAIGSYLLGVYSPDYDPGYRGEQSKWVDNGTLVYSSAFLLNAVLAGVRGDWAGVRPAN